MTAIFKALKSFVIILVLGVLVWGFVSFYPYIFAKNIEGVIEKVEKVELNVALMGTTPGEKLNPELYSFAIAIRAKDGMIHTASAEDRQWASMSQGRCVKAKYFPYPPWNLEKAGTFFGARLLEAWECP